MTREKGSCGGRHDAIPFKGRVHTKRAVQTLMA